MNASTPADLPPAVQASHQAPSIKAVAASDLPPDHTADLPRLLDSCKDIFDLDNHPPTQTSAVTHHINTNDASLVYRWPYCVSLAERLVIQKVKKKMLSKDTVEPSSSLWVSPVVLVREKDGT